MMTRNLNLIPGVLLFAAIVQSSVAAACVVKDGQLSSQAGWRWDSKSQGLYYGGNTSTAYSWAGGYTNYAGSGNYVLFFIPQGCVYQGVGQEGWRWDSKSQALVYAQSFTAKSPAGGSANTRGSASYVMYLKGSGEKWVGQHQDGWYWDSIGSGLFYAEGPSPAFSSPGGQANLTQSGQYILKYY